MREGILDARQADRLVAFLGGRAAAPVPSAPRFSFVHVLYYLGGMIAIGAMSLFMTLGWNALGGWGGFLTAVFYAVFALRFRTGSWNKSSCYIPAGIMATLAVVMVPLAIFAAQQALGDWGTDKPYRDYHLFIDWRWLTMEFGTLAVAAVLLWRYRFPFMLMPVAVTLWYMSMDLAPFLLGSERDHDWEIRKLIPFTSALREAARVLGGHPLTRLERLCVLALSVRGADILGRLSLMNECSELRQVRLLRLNVLMI